jgi:hypothetical protein
MGFIMLALLFASLLAVGRWGTDSREPGDWTRPAE